MVACSSQCRAVSSEVSSSNQACSPCTSVPWSLSSLQGLFPWRDVQAPDPGKVAHGLHTQGMTGGTPGKSIPMPEVPPLSCFPPGRGHYPGGSSPPVHWAPSSQQPYSHVLLAPEKGELSVNAKLEGFLGTSYSCSLQSLQTFSRNLVTLPPPVPPQSRVVICRDESGPSSSDPAAVQFCTLFPPPAMFSILRPGSAPSLLLGAGATRVQSVPPPGGHLEKQLRPAVADGSPQP